MRGGWGHHGGEVRNSYGSAWWIDCRSIPPFGFHVVPTPQSPRQVTIGVWPLGAYLGEEGLEKRIKVMVSPWTKYHSSMMPTVGKATGTYLNSYLCVTEARNKGYDDIPG